MSSFSSAHTGKFDNVYCCCDKCLAEITYRRKVGLGSSSVCSGSDTRLSMLVADRKQSSSLQHGGQKVEKADACVPSLLPFLPNGSYD